MPHSLQDLSSPTRDWTLHSESTNQVQPLCCAVLSRFSCVWLFTTLWTIAHQAPLTMGFSRQEYWSGLLCPPPGDLHDPRLKPRSPAPVGGFFTTSTTWEAPLTAVPPGNFQKLQKWSKEFPAFPASSNDNILPDDSSLWKKKKKKPENWDFPDGPVVKNLSSYAEHAGSILGQGTRSYMPQGN